MNLILDTYTVYCIRYCILERAKLHQRKKRYKWNPMMRFFEKRLIDIIFTAKLNLVWSWKAANENATFILCSKTHSNLASDHRCLLNLLLLLLYSSSPSQAVNSSADAQSFGQDEDARRISIYLRVQIPASQILAPTTGAAERRTTATSSASASTDSTEKLALKKILVNQIPASTGEFAEASRFRRRWPIIVVFVVVVVIFQ